MCGFVGLFLPRQASVIRPDIDRMIATIGHRGPDSRHVHISHDGRYQAAFTRLSIIDLTTGDQPIVEAGGERVVMGNGEIYNYRELRAAHHEYPWRTSGDMEVVLPTLSANAEEFPLKLNGMYALAIYERAPHRLWLCRDRFGIKPLYWARLANGGIAFASEIKALFASGLLDPEVDEEAVSSYLAHGWIPAPHTLFRGVRKLPPGGLLIVDHDGQLRETRSWIPQPQARSFKNEAEAAQELTELLDDSVRMQLRSDVPVGALLSGGLDSGLIVALAARQLDRPLKTFTVRFRGGLDETPLAAKVAERYGTDHTAIEVEQTSILNHMPALAWHCDEPLADASLLPNYLVEKSLSSHVKVVLNGTGGDELFAGYGRHYPMAQERRWRRLPNPLRRATIAALASVAPQVAWKLRRSESFYTDPGGYVHDHLTLFPPALRNQLGGSLRVCSPVQREILREFAGPQETAVLIADLAAYLPEDLLLLLDRTTMAFGVEGRVPFLDHRLAEAALAVPPSIRSPGGRQKHLERLMATPFLPPEVLNAPKRGFASPVTAWLQAGLAPVARNILTRKATLDRGWWSASGIERLLADPRRHGHRIYSLLMLEMVVRLHVEQRLDHVPTEGLEVFADG